MRLPFLPRSRVGIRDLSGKVAVVTGAASGIGRALTLGLRDKGCHLALVDMDGEGLLRLSPEVTGSGAHRVTTHVADVGDRARMRAVTAEVVAAHGGVQLLVNNAGIGHEAAFPQTSLDDWDRIVDTNLWGVIHGCHFFLPHLAKSTRAHIVNVSSLFGFVAMPGQSAYCTTKFALRGLSEALREELRTTSVGLTHVHSGAVATNIMRHAKGDDPELMKRLVRWFERKGMPPERVAARIIRAVEKGTPRLLIAPEVIVGDLVKRLTPTWGDKIMSEVAIRMIGLEDVRARRNDQWRHTMAESAATLGDGEAR
jgi:short-subunit dehydrogenase